MHIVLSKIILHYKFEVEQQGMALKHYLSIYVLSKDLSFKYHNRNMCTACKVVVDFLIFPILLIKLDFFVVVLLLVFFSLR